ncbi:hypothetical protein CHLNCDRAFT_144688 [Chlorella variabilis]|uniref:Chromo domain-containing protein n=1 Tax=Chlorella variabilis TaxID=554065 RepID=E1ZCT3_CHLVA|nr:hypothetical protein CHLNCDRAFT_144688 [Chlorella variabilis]EFN56296.1 hypothetical protein CHLNCDRAFT_144688 [Chlorella variabilis]|eukprot:XP_005848398.1 hypothetical protein CHLNCDRAFT_144688 [Chlorella variabilis]
MQLDLQQPAPVDLGELGEAAQRRQLAQLQEALAKGGASRLEHYVHNVVGALDLAPAMFGQRETYLDAVRRRQDREALAQLRTGSHWGAEETGRWTRRPREQREGEEWCTMEGVIDQRGRGSGTRYLCRFEGYGADDDMWLPASQITEGYSLVNHRPGTPCSTGRGRGGVAIYARSSLAFASAASYRAEAGRRAMHLLRRRLAENGLQDPLLSMRAFKSYVLPTLSYGAEIWAPQLILQGRTACERVQLEYLRGLLGVRDSTPALIVLAETGQLPLPAYWTLQVARFVSNLQAMGGERVARLAMLDSVALAADTDTGLPLARQPWAAQATHSFTDADPFRIYVRDQWAIWLGSWDT